MLSQLREFRRYHAALQRYLRTTLTEAECAERLRLSLEDRERSFLDVLERAVFAQPASPYARLFDHAGIELGDMKRLVADGGIEGALERVYDAGVYITRDEFRGAVRIERPGLSVSVRDEDFDNRLLETVRRGTTGGSRSSGRRVLRSFEHFEQSLLNQGLFRLAHGLSERPEAIWRPIPALTGLNLALYSVKLGRPLEKWFTQTRFGERPYPVRGAVITWHALLMARRVGRPLPYPEHVPYSEAARIARWLELKARQGTPAHFGAPVGSVVRVCLAARDHGLDISGSFLRGGGEPLTPERAEVMASTGSRFAPSYAMSEVGRVGLACAAPVAVDDLHLMLHKLAVLQRPRRVPRSGETVNALFFTTLVPSSPKLMINVETDDYAVVEERRCGCAIGELGFTRHLHTVRSYEKLTSEGMTLRGAQVVTLLERTLPERFGGAATDYQLVEDLDGALPSLSIVVSPRVGEIDDQDVVEVVLSELAHGGAAGQDISRIWRDARTLRVIRREPYATRRMSKILPVHVKR
jgi:hypothetical protein